MLVHPLVHLRTRVSNTFSLDVSRSLGFSGDSSCCLLGQGQSCCAILVRRRQVRQKEKVVKGQSQGQGTARRRSRQTHVRSCHEGSPHLPIYLSVHLDRATKDQWVPCPCCHSRSRQGRSDQENRAPQRAVDLQCVPLFSITLSSDA